MFTKIYGVGTMVHLAYPELVSEGGNIVLVLIYYSVKTYLIHRGIRKLRTLYIQADNVSYNIMLDALCRIGGLGKAGNRAKGM